MDYRHYTLTSKDCQRTESQEEKQARQRVQNPLQLREEPFVYYCPGKINQENLISFGSSPPEYSRIDFCVMYLLCLPALWNSQCGHRMNSCSLKFPRGIDYFLLRTACDKKGELQVYVSFSEKMITFLLTSSLKALG